MYDCQIQSRIEKKESVYNIDNVSLQIPVKVDLPGVGQNLHDHVLVFGQGVVFPRAAKGWHDWELSELYKFFTNRTGLFLSPAGVLGVGFVQ